MIRITETAREQIGSFFESRALAPIRIYVADGEYGKGLALTLDRQKDADIVIETSGYLFLVERSLFEQAKPVTIDATAMGLCVTSSLRFNTDTAPERDCTYCWA